MSRYEWERGELVLPPKDAKRIRVALRDEAEKRRGAILREVDGFFSAKGTEGKTSEAFQAAMARWYSDRMTALEDSGPGWRVDPATARANQTTREAVYKAHHYLTGRARAGQLAKPRARELNEGFPPAPKSGRVTYRLGDPGGASVIVDGNNLYWNVPENDRGVKEARGTPMGRRLFTELKRVQWTAGTGGTFEGGNDDSEQQWQETAAYGPLGNPDPTTRGRLAAAANAIPAKAGRAGKCGQPTLVNGRPTGPPCRHPANGCPAHGRARARR